MWGWSRLPALPLDPVRVPTSWSGLPGDPASQIVVDLSFRSLLRPSADGWRPDLATTWRYDADAREVTLALDPTAVWSDGSPVVAADVAASIARARADEASPFHGAALALADPGGVRVDDDGTLHLVFRPQADLGAAFALLAAMGVAPAGGPRLFPATGREVAAGPLVPAAERDGSVVLVARGPGSEAGPPIARFVALAEGATTEALGHSLDAAPVSPEAWAGAPHPGLAAVARPGGSVALLAFNTRIRVPGPTLDPQVRRALALALDEEALLRAAGPGSLPAGLPFPLLGAGQAAIREALAGAPASEAAGPAPGEGRAQAARLLDEAGWSEGPDGRRRVGGEPVLLHLAYVTGDRQAERVVEAVAEAWRGVGVAVEPEPLPAETFAERVFLEHAFDAALILWQPDDPYDPTPLYGSASRWNASGWSSPEVDEALARARATPDWAERLRALGAFWQAADRDAYLPLYAPAELYAVPAGLRGLDPSDADLGLLHWGIGR